MCPAVDARPVQHRHGQPCHHGVVRVNDVVGGGETGRVEALVQAYEGRLAEASDMPIPDLINALESLAAPAPSESRLP